MKKYLFLMMITASVVSAQQSDREFVIASQNYYYGEGISQSADEARDHALKGLSGQIAIYVASDFKSKIVEGKDLMESVESVLQTHTAATLRNVNFISEQKDDGRISVFCFLKKSEVEKIFQERKSLIADMVNEADKYTAAHNVAHALKLYYFSAVLLNSLPDEKVEYRGVNYTIEIPKRMNALIEAIQFQYVKDDTVSEKEREITFQVKHKNKPASLVDFTFWDGANQVAVQGRDGLATFCLIGASVQFDQLRLNVKYAYYESRDEFQVVESLWDVVRRPDFQSNKSIRLEKSEETEETETPSVAQIIEMPEKSAIQMSKANYNFDIAMTDEVPVIETIIKEAHRFLEVIESQCIPEVEKAYQDDPFFCEKAIHYIRHNHPKPLDTDIQCLIDTTKQGYELRRIRMLHNYPSIHKQSTEYLVLDFNQQGELIDLNTCISNQLYQKFVLQGEYGGDWGNRQEIIKFLEKYRMAYLTRDIKTVDAMFADSAIIIVGRILKTKKLPEDMVKFNPSGRQTDWEPIRMNKQTFLKRQQGIFKTMQDIFLDFSTFEINRKNNQPSIYGVEMRQTYLSTGYGDEGYLFLLIDFDPDSLTIDDHPLIYVRAWQPNVWSEDEKIRLGDWVVHK